MNKTFFSICTGLAGAAMTTAFTASALDLESLVSRNPRPPASHIVEVTHQNGRWIIGAENGVISHSADGENWSTVTVSYTKAIESVVFWNGTYYASGADGGTLLKSTDLVGWTESHPANFPYNTKQFLAANGSLYAVGDSPDLAVTSDGVTWQEVALPVDGRFEGIAANGSRLIVVGTTFDNEDTDSDGDSLEGIILASDNGTTWTTQLINVPINSSGLEDDFLSINYANGTFIAGGKQGLLATSSDGLAWTVRTTPFASWLFGVAYLNGSYYFPGRQGIIHKTANFTVWNDVQTESNQTMQDIFVAGSRMLTAGRDGIAAYSDDGATWPITTSGTREFFLQVEYGNGVYVAAEANAGIWWSVDSESWGLAYQDQDGDYLEGLVWDGSQFVGMSASGSLLTSANGEDWTESASAVVSGRVERLRKLNDVWWAVGASGLIASSTDLATWNPVTEGDDRFLDISYGNGTYVITGISSDNSQGIIYSSQDGVSWTKRVTTLADDNGTRLNTVAYANSKFVVLGQGSVLLTSIDGTAWTSSGVPGQTPFNCPNLNVIDGVFVAPDLNGIVATSTDGITWSRTQARTTRGFNDVAVSDERTVVVGSSGTIMSSTVTVVSGFAAWVKARFTTIQQDDPDVSGVDSDPDVDGRPNGVEYFSNTAPLVADAGPSYTPVIISDSGNDYPAVQIRRRTGLSDATIALRRSTDFSGWTGLTAGQIVEVSTTPLDTETESVIFRTSAPFDVGGLDFLQAGAIVTE